MKGLVSVVVACALAGALLGGCSKTSSSSSQSGAVTDSGSTGLKATPAAQSAAGGDAAHGKQIFSQNCSSCHGATGTEGGVGPSLHNEKSRKDMAKTIAWIKNPQPPMPKLFPSPLNEKDVADVAAYVQSI